MRRLRRAHRRPVIDEWQLVGEALRANVRELLRLFQLKRTRGPTLGRTDLCDYFTVRTFAGCSVLGSL